MKSAMKYEEGGEASRRERTGRRQHSRPCGTYRGKRSGMSLQCTRTGRTVRGPCPAGSFKNSERSSVGTSKRSSEGQVGASGV